MAAVVGPPFRTPVVVNPDEKSLGIRIPSERMYASSHLEEVCEFLATIDEAEARQIDQEIAAARRKFTEKTTPGRRAITVLAVGVSLAGCIASPIRMIMVNFDQVDVKQSIQYAVLLVFSIAGVIFGSLCHPNFESINRDRQKRLAHKIQTLQEAGRLPTLDPQAREQITKAIKYFGETLRASQGAS